jgi:hypothetical protein
MFGPYLPRRPKPFPFHVDPMTVSLDGKTLDKDYDKAYDKDQRQTGPDV